MATTNSLLKRSFRALLLLGLAPFWLAAPAAADEVRLSCRQGDILEGSCCCDKETHTYRFEPVEVSRLGISFDTGSGLGCESEVVIQALTRRGWKTLRTVDAVSSYGRSETYRLGGRFELGETLAGVRIGDGGQCHIEDSEVRLEVEGGPGRPHVDLKPGVKPLGPQPVPEPYAVEIASDSEPPYLVSSVVTLRQEPRPVKGARWFLGGEEISDDETLRWRLQEVGSYRIALRAPDGEILDTHKIDVVAQGVYRMSGKQLRLDESSLADRTPGVRNDNRELVLGYSASVFKVEGNAQRYCIWTMTQDHRIGEQVACGSEEDPLTGVVLLPGRYVVFPALAGDQRYCEVTLYLRRR